MGKAADNERIKLKATFFNNVSVGFVVAGLAVPISTFLYNGNVMLPEFFRFLRGQVSIWDKSNAIVESAFAITLAFSCAFLFRGLADGTLKKIQD